MRNVEKLETSTANRIMAGNNPNWPSRTGNPSGGGRGNNPPRKG